MHDDALACWSDSSRSAGWMDGFISGSDSWCWVEQVRNVCSARLSASDTEFSVELVVIVIRETFPENSELREAFIELNLNFAKLRRSREKFTSFASTHRVAIGVRRPT